MTDEELVAAVAAKRAAKASQPSQQETPQAPQQSSWADSPIVATGMRLGGKLGKATLEGGLKVLDVLDRYGNAPIRKGVDTGSVSAAIDQIGKSGAPTGKEVMAHKGVPTTPMSEYFPALFSDTGEGLPLKKGGMLDVSPAGVAGFGLETVDPTLLVGPALKGAGVLAQGAKAAASTTKLGRVAVSAAEKAVKFPSAVASKIAAAATGLPEEAISNYAKRASHVDEIIRTSGGDAGSAAQDFKEKLLKEVRGTAQKFSKEVGNAIESAPGASIPNINAAPIIDALEAARGKLNKDYDSQAIDLIEGFIEKVKNNTAEGQMSLKTMQETKQFLQSNSSKAFQRNGAIFNATPEQMKKASLAANEARFEARKILDDVGPVQLKEANAKLAELHRIEDNLDAKHFLKQSSSPNRIFTAGTGQNVRGNAFLRRLGKVTDGDYVQQAKDLASASSFGNAQILPRSAQGTTSTSRSLSIGGGGAMLGGAVGGLPGALVGSTIATALTSPAALKTAIKTGRFPLDLLTNISAGKASLSDVGIAGLYETLKSPAGQAAVNQYLNELPAPPNGDAIKRRAGRVGGK